MGICPVWKRDISDVAVVEDVIETMPVGAKLLLASVTLVVVLMLLFRAKKVTIRALNPKRRHGNEVLTLAEEAEGEAAEVMAEKTR